MARGRKQQRTPVEQVEYFILVLFVLMFLDLFFVHPLGEIAAMAMVLIGFFYIGYFQKSK